VRSRCGPPAVAAEALPRDGRAAAARVFLKIPRPHRPGAP